MPIANTMYSVLGKFVAYGSLFFFRKDAPLELFTLENRNYAKN